MTAEHYALLLVRAVERAQRGESDAMLKALAKQLARAEASREAARAGCRYDTCPYVLPGHRRALTRGPDGRPDYEDYTY
jgi:hypothetical protein